MKKFLSKVLTLALVCAIVVTGTSITSEAKDTKKTTSAKTFIDAVLASDGLTVNGQTLTTNQVAAMLKTNDQKE